VKERELSPAENDFNDFFRGNERLQQASIASFRRKVGKANDSDSPRVSAEDIIESERKRLKRARSPVLIMEDKSRETFSSRPASSKERIDKSDGAFDRRHEMNKRVSLEIRRKQRDQTMSSPAAGSMARQPTIPFPSLFDSPASDPQEKLRGDFTWKL
jgi:hypothetical protein